MKQMPLTGKLAKSGLHQTDLRLSSLKASKVIVVDIIGPKR